MTAWEQPFPEAQPHPSKEPPRRAGSCSDLMGKIRSQEVSGKGWAGGAACSPDSCGLQFHPSCLSSVSHRVGLLFTRCLVCILQGEGRGLPDEVSTPPVSERHASLFLQLPHRTGQDWGRREMMGNRTPPSSHMLFCWTVHLSGTPQSQGPRAAGHKWKAI